MTLGERVKYIRNLTGMNRREVYEQSEKTINQNTLAAIESGRNTLTVQQAIKLLDFADECGVTCSLEWLLTGIGNLPTLKSNEVEYAFNAIQEADEFKKLNPGSITLNIDSTNMSPILNEGDIIGAVPYKFSFAPTLSVILSADGGTKVSIAKVSQNAPHMILTYNLNNEFNCLELEKILKAYKVIWMRCI